jgi:hypothetical protein
MSLSFITTNTQVNHFFTLDGFSLNFVSEFDKWTNEFNGVYRIGSVDCDDFAKLCSDQGVTTFPTFKVYPPIPVPATDINVTDHNNSVRYHHLKNTKSSFQISSLQHHRNHWLKYSNIPWRKSISP